MSADKPQRILIVDDEALIRWSLRERLEAEGMEVLEAEDATSAMDLISTNGICAAVLDLRLPDMSGLDVLRAFRIHHPDCPAWIMTAYGNDWSRELAERLKVREFLDKPFDIDELVQKIKETMLG